MDYRKSLLRDASLWDDSSRTGPKTPKRPSRGPINGTVASAWCRRGERWSADGDPEQ